MNNSQMNMNMNGKNYFFSKCDDGRHLYSCFVDGREVRFGRVGRPIFCDKLGHYKNMETLSELEKRTWWRKYWRRLRIYESPKWFEGKLLF